MTSIAAVVCVYNGALYLDQALGSVAAQRRPVDEVVVVDDGSTDESVTIAERWRALLPLNVVRLDRNGGLAAARRTAVASAKSDLIALLDADDFWLPDHVLQLERQYVLHEGLITSSALRWVEGEQLGARGNLAVHPIPPPDEQLEQILSQNFVFIGAMFARSLHDEVGGFRSVHGSPSCEDWDLWIRMIYAGTRVYGDSTPSMLYRLRHDSLSGIGDDRLAESEIAVLLAYIEEHDGHPSVAHARRSLRQHEARREFRASYEAAADGRAMSARRHALAAMHGSRATRVRALGMVVAPTTTAAVRRRLQQRATWLVRQ